jgi:3-deoxy-D-manno-octulosonic-acid transferase
MYFVYSLIFSIGILLTAPYYLWRLRGKQPPGTWGERFGRLPKQFAQPRAGSIWIHAVSVGETLAAVGLVTRLQKEFPERLVFLSHVTVAGREAGGNRLPDAAGRFFLPLDWKFAMRRVFETLKPALLVIAETELWPNLLHTAHDSGTRVALVNARISDRSYGRYRAARFLMRKVLANVDYICTQTEVDAERFRQIGARPGTIIVTGNLKFDAQPPQLGEFAMGVDQALKRLGRGPVVIAASTMPGEEKMLLRAWEQIRRANAQALLVLAPRHPARFDEVAQLLQEAQVSFIRRSTLGVAGEALGGQLGAPQVLLLDTIGELAGIFEIGDAVFVGGSLVPTGGHNILEPAYWGKPIFFGPYMHNFRDIAEMFVRGRGAIQLAEEADLAAAIGGVLADASKRSELGENAKSLVAQWQGATDRTLARLRILLAERASR